MRATLQNPGEAGLIVGDATDGRHTDEAHAGTVSRTRSPVSLLFSGTGAKAASCMRNRLRGARGARRATEPALNPNLPMLFLLYVSDWEHPEPGWLRHLLWKNATSPAVTVKKYRLKRYTNSLPQTGGIMAKALLFAKQAE